MSNCKHGRMPDRCTECVKETHIEQLEQANALLRKENGINQEAARHWRELVAFAVNRSSEALMIAANRPREARAARDNALCDINKKLGGALR